MMFNLIEVEDYWIIKILLKNQNNSLNIVNKGIPQIKVELVNFYFQQNLPH